LIDQNLRKRPKNRCKNVFLLKNSNFKRKKRAARHGIRFLVPGLTKGHMERCEIVAENRIAVLAVF
jgi:hypothetical protein